MKVINLHGVQHKEEFYDFINNYPRKLKKDVNHISEPPTITWNDFTKGDWPESVIATAQEDWNGDWTYRILDDNN